MTPDEIARALAERLPDVRVEPLTVLRVGFGSTVVETADGVIVRIARHERARLGHERERALLPLLQGRLSVAIPEPRWFIEPDSIFRFGAIAYRKLRGRPLALEEADPMLAVEVAAFLRELHRVDPRGLGLEAEPERERLEGLRAETLPFLRGMLSAGELDRVEHWWDDALAPGGLTAYEPALVHGDLWYENLLVERGRNDGRLRLVGVVDWEAAGLGDRADDFAALLYLGEPFAEAALALYGPVDARFRRRIEQRLALREFAGIRIAAALEDEAELRACVEKLRATAVLARRTPE